MGAQEILVCAFFYNPTITFSGPRKSTVSCLCVPGGGPVHGRAVAKRDVKTAPAKQKRGCAQFCFLCGPKKRKYDDLDSIEDLIVEAGHKPETHYEHGKIMLISKIPSFMFLIVPRSSC